MSTGEIKLQEIESFPLVTFSMDRGPLHTLQVDEAGNLYYSDEVNHAVVCMDQNGNLQWKNHGAGQQPGQFRYPRGIALGQISHGGNLWQCLAVADAWNRRIQFFDRQGGFIKEWCTVSGSTFGEPVDIRFIAPAHSNGNDDTPGHWVVLDKDRHKLWIIDCDGCFLGSHGTEADTGLVARWRASGEFPNLEKIINSSLPDDWFYDFLYYPGRMLGGDSGELFIWEPLAGCLKLSVSGHFIPLSIGIWPDRQWIAADDSGLLEWSREKKSLNAYDPHGRLLFSGEMDGMPIPSNLPADQFWLQRDRRIIRMKVADMKTEEDGLLRPAQSLLLHSAHVGLQNLNAEDLSRKMTPALNALSGLTGLCDDIVRIFDGHDYDDVEPDRYWERLHTLANEWQRERDALFSCLNVFNMQIWQLQLALGRLELEDANAPGSPKEWDFLLDALCCRIAGLVDRSDDLFAYLEHSYPDLPENIIQLRFAGVELHAASGKILDWISRWMGSVQPDSGLRPTLNGEIGQDGTNLLNRKRGRPVSRSNNLLCELDAWECPGPDADADSSPYCVASNRSGDFFVSLFAVNRVLRLDRQGVVKDTLGAEAYAGSTLNGPTGLAFDRNDCMWLADAFNQRILIMDRPYMPENIVKVLESPELNMNFPSGLIALGDDRMLLADPREKTVLCATGSGSVHRVIETRLAGGDAVRFPISFCADALDPENYFCLVDMRNHRILKLNARYEREKAIGSFGFAPGCLRYPEGAAMFSDGTLVVSDGFRFPRLVFFTKDGEETGSLRLDYTPKGLYIESDLLYVCRSDGSTIYRYCRG